MWTRCWVIWVEQCCRVKYCRRVLGSLSQAVLPNQILSSSVVECRRVLGSLSRAVLPSQMLSSIVFECCWVSSSIVECRRVFSSAVENRRVPSSIFECRRESSSAVEYFRVPSRIVECRRVFSSSVKFEMKNNKKGKKLYCLLWWSLKEWRPISLVDPFYTFLKSVQN